MISNTKQVGITGGIGAGKSIVCKIFSALGIPIYDADARAKQLMQESPDLRKQITENFGKKSYLSNGELNRSYLAAEVFENPKRVSMLNKLVHPVVAQDYRLWVAAKASKSPYLVKEAALLVESGSYLDLDFLITVLAPQELRLKRVLHRDSQRSRKQVLSIMSNQLSDAQRIEKSHYIIDNDEQQMLIPQVLKLHQRFIGSKD